MGWINVTANGSVDVGILYERNLSIDVNASIEEGITNFGGKGYFVYHIKKEVSGTLSIKIVPQDQQEIIVVSLFNESLYPDERNRSHVFPKFPNITENLFLIFIFSSFLLFI